MAYYPGNGSNSPKINSSQNHMRAGSGMSGGGTQNKFGFKQPE